MRYLSDFLFLGSSSLIAACGDTHDNKSVDTHGEILTHVTHCVNFIINVISLVFYYMYIHTECHPDLVIYATCMLVLRI